MSNLTLGSLFDGSGGFPLGGVLAGITPVWASEIEPFPIRVTTRRFPKMKHYGNISEMNGAEIEPVDIITFGSPCQDMSIAGRRSGLEGNRSSLFFEAVRIIKEMRGATNGKYPHWVCWENVPGAFSSNAGLDFKAVLENIIGIVEGEVTVPMPDKCKWPHADLYLGDRWSVAYRTLDAQYWGVPQRRKRIYLVADLAGRSAGDILFKSEGLSGYSAESFRSWQRAACSSEGCIGATGFDGYNGQLTGNASATLGVNCGMSTGRNGVILNDQGGNRMDVTDDVTCTLRAEAHHPPCVMEAAGFCTEHSAKARGIGYEEECAPTLRASTVPAALSIENHAQDSRYRIDEEGKVQTLTSCMGTGGNNVPLLLKIRSGCEGGGKGPLIQEDCSATLSCNNDQTLFEPRVFGICSKDSNAMKSSNPHSGFYEAKTTRTLDANGGNPSCNQGGMAVVAYGIDRAAFNQGASAQFGFTVEEEVEPTIVAKGPGAVATPTFSSSKASFFTESAEELANTLVATDYKDPPLVNDKAYGFYPQMKAECVTLSEEKATCLVNGTNPGFQNGVVENEYIVRRLTPTECARLQGFPDWWCSDLGTAEPTDDEVDYWSDVWETHRIIMGTSQKPKTKSQIRKWLCHPHSDSAEYKMWGNGVALPCVYFVLSGIAWAADNLSQ